MSQRTSCIHIYFGIWVADAALNFFQRESWLLMNVRSDVLLNWMYRWSLHASYGNQKHRFFLCLENANSFESLFTWMMCCLIKSIYIWGMNSFFTSFVFLTVKRNSFGDTLCETRKKKQAGSKWVYKKDSTPNIQLQNYNNTNVHHKGGQIMRQLEKYTIKYKDCASYNLKASKIYWFISTHLHSVLRIWQRSARSVTFKRNKVSWPGEQCLSKISTASRNQNTHTHKMVWGA